MPNNPRTKESKSEGNAKHGISNVSRTYTLAFAARLYDNLGGAEMKSQALQARFRWALLLLGCALTAAVLSSPAPRVQAADPSFDALADDYSQNVRPLFQRHCTRCHGSKKHEADVNFEQFSSLAEVRKATRTWQKVLEMLDSGQMPPSEAKQPSEADRARLRSWVRSYLKAEARAQAGDPGPVVLRRLSNAEYTYTIRDLTGVDLQPARQFPVDGAAGEGFTNTGQALVMSPALLGKYLDAAKEIASHALLLPDGIGFSPGTTQRDWTDELLARIRDVYRRHSSSQGGTRVNLQGIVFDTNDGGRLPVEAYLAATLAERDSLSRGDKTPDAVARERGLNARYLASLRTLLNSKEPSPLLDQVRGRWRNAKPDEAAALAADIGQWQKLLTKFQNVGHMKRWMLPVDPLTSRQEVRSKVPSSAGGKDVTLYLLACDAGDGFASDFVVWQQPRLVIPGRPDLPLCNLRDFTREMLARRERVFASADRCLTAAAEATGNPDRPDLAELARRHDVDPEALSAWFKYLGIGNAAAPKLDYFTDKITKAGGYDFVTGWGKLETPQLVANASDRHVRIPGNMKPHGVCVHPSPTLQAAVGWRSPLAGAVRIDGKVTHAHPECGNGVTWSLELRRGATRQRLASGIAQGSKDAAIGPIDRLVVQPGDLVSLLIGPRDGNHACDLTDIELILKATDEPARDWRLTRDISNDVLSGNPHADRFGNKDVWHFYTEAVKGGDGVYAIPAGSLLARWLSADGAAEKKQLAQEVRKLLTGGPPAPLTLPSPPGGRGQGEGDPDAALYRQLASVSGPLLGDGLPPRPANQPTRLGEPGYGPDPALFGKHPNGSSIDAPSLCVQAPSVIEVRLPADLFAGAELVATGVLHRQTGAEGSVQLQIGTNRVEPAAVLRPDLPVLVAEASETRARWERSFDEFRRWFPAALCYVKIVPVDEVITLTLFHREDEPLCRLMLDEKEKAELDQLWRQLHFVSHDALTAVDAFAQLLEYASQDSDPKLFEPFRQPIHERAAAFRKQLQDAEPRHVDAVLDFAARAYRRPLTEEENRQLRDLYGKLRQQELPHAEAVRLTLARVLVSPAFLYRLEKPVPGARPGPVSDWELAGRLSYFLWSSMPDAELREAAAMGKLHESEVLVAQARRMLKDARVRRLAIEFGCQWLHIHGFDTLDEKSERHFPGFAGLRGDMYEEAIRFFTDLFRHDASVLSLLDADRTFVNEALAKHYGIPWLESRLQAGEEPAKAGTPTADEWRRVDGMRRLGRGGILGLSATLAKQSGASRTSPILRGNWVSEVLLGEKLPRPPKDVPRLPEDEADTEGLTVRQLVEKHSSDPRCAVCHARIDGFGLALEGFDAIGRRRDKDLGQRPIVTRGRLKDGTEIDSLDGLRQYLLTARRDAFVQQFCRKLLGYALGRGVQLSDEPLLEDMQRQLEKKGYRFSAAVEAIVRSRQFREIRGKDAGATDEH